MTFWSAFGRSGLLALALFVGACSDGGCSGCSCKGGDDVERTQPGASEPERRRDPPIEPAEPQDDPAAQPSEPTPRLGPSGSGAASGGEVPAGESDPSTGTIALDRPTSGQVGVVLRDLRGRAAECSRGIRRSVVVELTISGRSGRATSARAIGPSAGTPEATCVENLMREAQFPTFARTEMLASYAYLLPGVDPDGGAATPGAEAAIDAGIVHDDAGDVDAGTSR